MPAPVDLLTPRLLLRAWREEDAADFHRIWGDPEVIWWGPAKSPEESRAFLARLRERTATSPAPLAWRAAIERATGRVVGNVCLQPAPWAPEDVEVGWHLARDSWGRGFATEGAGALVDEAFRVLSPPRVVAAIHVDNARSRRVADRLGFVRIAGFERAGMPHDLFSRERPPADGGSGGPPAPS